MGPEIVIPSLGILTGIMVPIILLFGYILRAKIKTKPF